MNIKHIPAKINNIRFRFVFIVIVMLVEINEDRECIGKEAFDSMVHTEYVHDEETGEEVKKTSTKTITESTIDPESGCFHKGEKEKCFAYSHQTFCNKNPENMLDSLSIKGLSNEIINNVLPYSKQLPKNLCVK